MMVDVCWDIHYLGNLTFEIHLVDMFKPYFFGGLLKQIQVVVGSLAFQSDFETQANPGLVLLGDPLGKGWLLGGKGKGHLGHLRIAEPC